MNYGGFYLNREIIDLGDKLLWWINFCPVRLLITVCYAARVVTDNYGDDDREGIWNSSMARQRRRIKVLPRSKFQVQTNFGQIVPGNEWIRIDLIEYEPFSDFPDTYSITTAADSW